ncbi:HAMP domain-containing histidine kinase [Candidatus Poribacteria bacterium]|nr:HAMP domain-containing histidine kinase [Candidatus Poribacteria bacterium]
MPSVPPEMFDLAAKIRGQLDRISALAEGMQRLSRPLELRKQMMNINGLVQRTVRDSQTTHECEVVFDLCEPDPILTVDVDGIDEAMTQLAGNAWMAMENKGKLLVKTQISSPARCLRLRGTPDKPFVLISLTDSGPGVPASIREDCFNAGVSTTGSAGLGLYSVKIIAEEHGGAAWLEDTGPNGSTFIVALPMR